MSFRKTLELSGEELDSFIELIDRDIGIKSSPEKKTLLEGRLSKRVAARGLSSFAEYFTLISGKSGDRDEYLRFLDLVTTHETSFFREERHFDYLANEALTKILRRKREGPINALCAACSSGEESYSIAMTLRAALDNLGLSALPLSVEGFDISPRMAEIATRGVYPDSRRERIPSDFFRTFCMESRVPGRGVFRIVPELRSVTLFHPGNLLGSLNCGRSSYDVIFCRNVLIYFNRERQIKAIHALLARLSPGGFLFLGHSESVSGMDLPIEHVASAVYRKRPG